MTLEKFTEKYFPNAVQGVEEKNDVVTDMQDVTNRFPISDLPVDILCEVYDRLSIISANTAQKLVCRKICSQISLFGNGVVGLGERKRSLPNTTDDNSFSGALSACLKTNVDLYGECI
jgi:hypothetical protein